MALRDQRTILAGAGLELRFGVAAGAAANTNIAVPGIKPSDILVAVVEMAQHRHTENTASTYTQNAQTNYAVSTLNNRVSQATIAGEGNIRLSVSTSGSQLLVVWWSV